MNENLIELINKINGSPEYQKNLAQCKSKEELFEYCSSIHNGYTPEELNHFILGIASINKLGVANINKLKDKTDVINDTTLKKICGGSRKYAQINNSKNNYSIPGKITQINKGTDTLGARVDSGKNSYVEIGTVEQIRKKMGTADTFLRSCGGFVDIANRLADKNIEDMSYAERMNLVTELLNSFGCY